MSVKIPSILIVEDEVIVASDIERNLLKLGYRVAGSARGGDDALDLLANRAPDLALLDIDIRGSRNGIELARLIRQKYRIPFVFLTSSSDRTTILELRDTMPYGYIVKPFSPGELLTTIELALHKHAAERRLFPPREELNARLRDPLTTREYEILRLLDRGLSYREIGERIFISLNTVKYHQKSVFAKLGAGSRLEALRRARGKGTG